MNKWGKLAPKEIVDKTIKVLKTNGIEALYVENGREAKQKTLSLIPKGAEVMTMSSVTLETIGLTSEINESGEYDSLKTKLFSMNRETQGKEMSQIAAAPNYAIGSVHAVTQDGQVMVASNTGSQLGAYAYSAGKVVWIVGSQKIVKDINEGFKRIYEHSLVLESERLKKVYGVPSNVSKILIFNKETVPDRITLIFVDEKLGF